MTQTTYQIADAAMASYESFIFAAVGRAWGETQDRQATALAFNAADACKAAGRDRAHNQFTRDIYRAHSFEFEAIAKASN